MAHEFRIKNGLLIDASTNSVPVIAIRDGSAEITTDASSILATGKAIYDFVDYELMPIEASLNDAYGIFIPNSSVGTSDSHTVYFENGYLESSTGVQGVQGTQGTTGSQGAIGSQGIAGAGNPASAAWGSGAVGSNNQVLTAMGDGSIYAESNLTFDGTTLATGNVTATGEVTTYYSSDERLKKDIKQFSALDIIKKLEPKKFKWNDKAKELNPAKDDRDNYGLIAQEVEKVIPEIVHPIYDEYKAVDYVQLIPVLIQAVKELCNEK